MKIYKIIFDNGITLPPDDISHEHIHNEVNFEIYCNKFIDLKFKNNKDSYDITIRHKLYVFPNVEITEDGELITNRTEITKLFNKVLINIKK